MLSLTDKLVLNDMFVVIDEKFDKIIEQYSENQSYLKELNSKFDSLLVTLRQILELQQANLL